MRSKQKLVGALVLLGTIALAPVAHAEATRTWVSGVGDDANPCSRTAPCKTWAGAISKTAPGGEIDALDPGGFGAVTITKSITLDGGGGQVASVLVSSGSNGINVAAGTNDVVTLRNLRIDGLSPGAGPGLNGISFTSGRILHVQNVNVFGFSQSGLVNTTTSPSSLVTIDNSSFQNNNVGVNNTGTGRITVKNSNIDDNTSAGVSSIGANGVVNLWNVSVTGTGSGLQNQVPGSTGVGANNGGKVVMTNSWVSSAESGVAAGSGNAAIFVSNCVITENNTGLVEAAGATISTDHTNRVFGNGTDGTFNGAFSLS